MEKKQAGNARNSNLELLRIIAMVLIIGHHFAVHGEFQFATNVISLNRLWILFLNMGGKIGVNIFILISGLFLVKAERVKINKLLRLWLQIFTYSIGIFLVYCFVGKVRGSKELIKCFFPISYLKWWFVSDYFILYLISPYINELLRNLNKQKYLNMILLTTIIWSIGPTFLASMYEKSELVWFIYLYALAGYISLWGDKIELKFSASKAILIACLFAAITYLSAVAIDILGVKYAVFTKYVTHFYGQEQFPILLTSLFLVIGFKNLEIRHNKWINAIASSVLGIYLIHDNGMVREYLWKNLFKNAQYSCSPMLILYSIGVIVVVFLGCSLIELIRANTFEKLYLKKVDDVSVKIENNIKKIEKTEVLHKL